VTPVEELKYDGSLVLDDMPIRDDNAPWVDEKTRTRALGRSHNDDYMANPFDLITARRDERAGRATGRGCLPRRKGRQRAARSRRLSCRRRPRD